MRQGDVERESIGQNDDTEELRPRVRTSEEHPAPGVEREGPEGPEPRGLDVEHPPEVDPGADVQRDSA